MRHNKLREGVKNPAVKDFTPTHVRNDTLIVTGCAVKRPKENPAGYKNTESTADTPRLEATEKKGDTLIRDLCNNGTDSVHDMRIMNTDAK